MFETDTTAQGLTPDFRALFESAPGCFLVLAPDLSIVAASDAYLRATGTTRGEIVGRGFFEVFPEPHGADGARELRDSLARVLRDRIPDAPPVRKLALPRRGAPGGADEERYWSLLHTPVLSAGGAVAYVIQRVEDVTESVLPRQEEARHRRIEEALRESEERLHFTLQAARMGSWKLDLATTTLTCCETCKANFGRSDGAAFGYDDLLAAILPGHRDRVREAIARAVEGRGDYEVECPVAWPDGSIHWLLARGRASVGPSGQPQHLVGLTLDITETRRTQEALREADRRKDEFVAMLAHELRNPLAAITNAAALCRRIGGESYLPWSLEIIDRQAAHLAHLIDDLLDVARITRGQIRLRTERLRLGDVVDRAVESTRPLIEGRRHELTVALPEGPLWLDADPIRLEQILENLLSNAAKYTEPGGRLRLAAGVEGDQLVIRVSDSGIGMPPEMLPRVFDLFAQADRSLDRPQGGLGVGLTLVRSLAEMHGGSVEAHSDGPGRGSEFVVRLPAPHPPPTPGPTAATGDTTAGGRSRRVLVVDDNVDSAQSLAMLIELAGHESRVAHDGPSALEAAAAFRPEVMLLDIGLPGLDGYQVARRLRQAEGPVRTTLIALTGYGQNDDRRRTREAGFDYHLTKPVDFDALLPLLERLEPQPTGPGDIPRNDPESGNRY